jgi:hypothetical protein
VTARHAALAASIAILLLTDLAAAASAARVVTVSRRSVNFGVVSVGSQSNAVSLDANASGRTVAATLSDPAGDFRVIDNSCTGVSASCRVHVAFAPRSEGRKRATLSFASGGAVVDTALSGSAVASPGPVVPEAAVAIALPCIALVVFGFLTLRRASAGTR